jgi:hypothetical protein
MARTGDIVEISPYDWYDTNTPAPDDPERPATHVRTVGQSNGTVYLIQSIRRIVPRGSLPIGCIGRYLIRAVKLGDSAGVQIPNDSRVISLRWNDRGKKQRKGT